MKTEEIAQPATKTALVFDDPTRLTIQINERQMDAVVDDAITTLELANEPPTIFTRGLELSTLLTDTDGRPSLHCLTTAIVRDRLSKGANWVRLAEDDELQHANPPSAICTGVLARKEWPGIPALRGIIHAPALGKDAKMVVERGYDADTQLYLHTRDGFDLPDTTPTVERIAAARTLLVDELLGDFPFADQASRAHAVALILLGHMRHMIDGCTPIHLIDAPKAGTGKGLLADVCTQLAVPDGACIKTQPTIEAEWSKMITSVLRSGASHLLIDNARQLDSPALYGALTARHFTDRLLGGNAMIRMRNDLIWLATCNNVAGTDELSRRSVWIRLDSSLENPDERSSFRHPNLQRWLHENRMELLGAVITLLRAWQEAGMPLYSARSMGSFEVWAATLGGILDVAGIEGFLDNREALKERVDNEGALWRSLVAHWTETFGETYITPMQLFEVAQNLMADRLGNGSDKAMQSRWGKLMKGQVDRVYGSYKIEGGPRATSGPGRGSSTYRLRAVTAG